jgi:hypothetical protein
MILIFIFLSFMPLFICMSTRTGHDISIVKKYLSLLTNEKKSYKRPPMTKEKLIEILKGILNTDIDLGFLAQLKENEIENLVACIRERVDAAIK